MPAISSTSPEEVRAQLVEAGLLVPTRVDGLFGRSDTYESVVSALNEFCHALGKPRRSTVLSFPPIVDKAVFERTGFPEAFPNLVGAVRCFSGSDEDHVKLLKAFSAGRDWAAEFGPSDVVLASAACHPIYPRCTGTVAAGGQYYEICGYCFRHEPSPDPTRLQAFRMYEHVYVGEPETALSFRDDWLAVAVQALQSLGLDVTTDAANDPFFGRTGSVLAGIQREEERKIEILYLLPGYQAPTAIASGNWHKDHFGESFEIRTAAGETAHSACMAFGLDRITISLLCAHGLEPGSWPSEVRSALGW